MKKRILVLLSVVALMVVMLATSVAPAFAAWTAEGGQCRDKDMARLVFLPGEPEDRNGDSWLCLGQREREHKGVLITTTYFYDNRGF